MNAQEEQIYLATILANRALILQVVENHYPNAVIDAVWGGYTDDDMYDAIKEEHFPEMDDADYDNAYYSITEDDEDADDSDGEWCNEDCEENEGCIKCNPFAYCSPATLEELLAKESKGRK